MPPASVGIDAFPNKKPRLLGDVIVENESAVQSNIVGSSPNFSERPLQSQTGAGPSNYINLNSINVQEGEKVLFSLYMVSAVEVGATVPHKLVRDSTILGTFFTSINPPPNTQQHYFNQIVDDPGPGDYVYHVRNDDTNVLTYTGIRFVANVIKAVDTHTTKNINIISG